MNTIQIIASDSIIRIWTANAVWKGAVRPPILYAGEVIGIDVTETKTKSLQGEMGR